MRAPVTCALPAIPKALRDRPSSALSTNRGGQQLSTESLHFQGTPSRRPFLIATTQEERRQWHFLECFLQTKAFPGACYTRLPCSKTLWKRAAKGRIGRWSACFRPRPCIQSRFIRPCAIVCLRAANDCVPFSAGKPGAWSRELGPPP